MFNTLATKFYLKIAVIMSPMPIVTSSSWRKFLITKSQSLKEFKQLNHLDLELLMTRLQSPVAWPNQCLRVVTMACSFSNQSQHITINMATRNNNHKVGLFQEQIIKDRTWPTKSKDQAWTKFNTKMEKYCLISEPFESRTEAHPFFPSDKEFKTTYTTLSSKENGSTPHPWVTALKYVVRVSSSKNVALESPLGMEARPKRTSGMLASTKPLPQLITAWKLPITMSKFNVLVVEPRKLVHTSLV